MEGWARQLGGRYLTDVSDDEEWEFVLPYLLLSRADNRSAVHRRPHGAVHAGVGRTGRLRWRQAPQGLEGAHRGRAIIAQCAGDLDVAYRPHFLKCITNPWLCPFSKAWTRTTLSAGFENS